MRCSHKAQIKKILMCNHRIATNVGGIYCRERKHALWCRNVMRVDLMCTDESSVTEETAVTR